MTALARIKVKGVKPAIAANGGIDGAAATVEKGRSLVGDWNNVNHDALPNLAQAFAVDEVALATSGRAPILQALAAELGHVAILLPDPAACEDRIVMALCEATAEFGDIAGAVTEALRDGTRTEGENLNILAQIDEAQAALARMRVLVCAPSSAGREGCAEGTAALPASLGSSEQSSPGGRSALRPDGPVSVPIREARG